MRQDHTGHLDHAGDDRFNRGRDLYPRSLQHVSRKCLRVSIAFLSGQFSHQPHFFRDFCSINGLIQNNLDNLLSLVGNKLAHCIDHSCERHDNRLGHNNGLQRVCPSHSLNDIQPNNNEHLYKLNNLIQFHTEPSCYCVLLMFSNT